MEARLYPLPSFLSLNSSIPQSLNPLILHPTSHIPHLQSAIHPVPYAFLIYYVRVSSTNQKQRVDDASDTG